MNKIVNTCVIDSIYGNKTINLIKEDIVDSHEDMIIFSIHQKNKNEIEGSVFNSLKKKFKLKANSKNSCETNINGMNVKYFQEEIKDEKYNFLMATMESYEGIDDVLSYHDKNVRAIFAFIKALEFNEKKFRTIALPMLGGNRNIDYMENIKILLNYTIKLLKQSKEVEIVNFYILDDEEEVKWNHAFEKTLGRTYYKQGSLALIETLKNNLKDTIETIYNSGKYREIEYVLNLIYRELEEVDSLSINNIAINSRKISEIIAKEIASRKQINIHKIKYDLSAIINVIASKDIIAPWAIQYLHTARVFGNKSAHVETVIKYQPNRLYTDDFISILSTLYNMLWFWYYNKEKI
ncbi:hypothetical protein KQI77_06485 [Clostridium sp. MSJ-8]|uniref:hypothetical protein n=1 Tax=Clostridium sp. MSJ-8 TaxID=2841510 RepID=UPI001C0F230F|nr:hypothetical protein [Clostridium sp. MSJ-8]MBU5487816.1 hypothetical protein [Clostridium sp. MSJ-8]